MSNPSPRDSQPTETRQRDETEELAPTERRPSDDDSNDHSLPKTTGVYERPTGLARLSPITRTILILVIVALLAFLTFYFIL